MNPNNIHVTTYKQNSATNTKATRKRIWSQVLDQNIQVTDFQSWTCLPETSAVTLDNRPLTIRNHIQTKTPGGRRSTWRGLIAVYDTATHGPHTTHGPLPGLGSGYVFIADHRSPTFSSGLVRDLRDVHYIPLSQEYMFLQQSTRYYKSHSVVFETKIKEYTIFVVLIFGNVNNTSKMNLILASISIVIITTIPYGITSLTRKIFCGSYRIVINQ